MTDAHGRASIDGLTGDTLTFTALGYADLRVPRTALASGETAVALHALPFTLREAVVSVNRWEQGAERVPDRITVMRPRDVALYNPGTAADNMRTSDQLDMFNGAPDKYDWKLVGKKEIYVPYNAYKLQDPAVKFKDILTPLHMNPDHLRYELHRVWVVDATLKKGERHTYKRRTFYIDADSWQILRVDQNDTRDHLWPVSDGHAITHSARPPASPYSDDSRATPSADGPNTYVVSKVTKEAGITMALSGLGGDEVDLGALFEAAVVGVTVFHFLVALVNENSAFLTP